MASSLALNWSSTIRCRLTILDRMVAGELRCRTVGVALHGVVLVAPTLHETSGGVESVRLISARYAPSSERKAYEEGA